MVLKKACADVLGLPQFDENIFSAEVEHIEIPAQDAPVAPNEMIFFFNDGRIISNHWVSTSKKAMCYNKVVTPSPEVI